ncbi:small multi-drug export protein [Alkalicoccus saliphilus]|uniref:DNA-binding protein n=1 Tax=Alkalicoccus saliphilus TaxID=200989 RepID=A0A2T4U4B2_9BACI|nr:small multi-drug export protein [Alkalicoccus saliphilus]PTL38209.1 hypothetical protein C6Y45_12455 [Alkalicoccus saliphilus]
MENVFLQYVMIFLVSTVPFFEVFITIPTAIIVFNLSPVLSLVTAFLGNCFSVLLFIYFGGGIRKLYHTFSRKYQKKERPAEGMSPRMKKTFDRFGVIGVCFFSSILVSSQIGATTMASVGASKRKVFLWTNLGVLSLAVVMAISSVVATEFVIRLVDVEG